MKTLLILILSLSFTLSALGQKTNTCDTIYENPQTKAKYENGEKGLTDYLSQKLIPLLSDCIKKDSTIISRLYINLSIDINGKIIAAEFPKLQATENCKATLKNELLTMTGWIPGQNNGQNVCSKYLWLISCLNWRNE